MMLRDGAEYFGTHFYWDADDNEYICCATWQFEKNYPDMPDYWHLKAVEVEQYNGQHSVLCIDVEEGDPIWLSVENDGCPVADLVEKDYE